MFDETVLDPSDPDSFFIAYDVPNVPEVGYSICNLDTSNSKVSFFIRETNNGPPNR